MLVIDYNMTNNELAAAIDFAQHIIDRGRGFASTTRSKPYYSHLENLLKIQLDRALLDC